MDFFAQQARVKRSSRRLVWLFALAVLAIVVAVDLVFAFVVGVGLRPAPLLGIALVVVVVIGLCSAYRVSALSGGGAVVAREMNAVEVPADTSNPQWQRLRNVIEEIAIASGVPVPEIYVMQNEAGINAFAAGYTPSDAAVCVTQGCLDKLNRDELQGVIAHEFSHVLNGDMRLNIRLMGLLFGIMAIWVVGRFLMWGGYFGLGGGRDRRRGGGSGQVALAGIALLAIGAIGVFFGRLIQAAVSRARESLADASAVQFTRQTTGIAGALKKIAVFEEGSALQSPRKDEVRHMLFGDAEASSLFATHPPIMARIKALEPGFKPEELDAYVKQWLASGGDPDHIELHASLHPWEKAVHEFAQADGDVDIRTSTPMPAAAARVPGFPKSPAGSAAVPARGAELAITAAGVAAQVATPGTDDYQAATDLHARIPGVLAAAAHDPRGALATVFALAVSDHPELMTQQLQTIAQAFGAALADATRQLAVQMADLHPMLRLPLAQLAFPALKRRPRADVDKCVQTLDALIHADGRVDLDEYCLARLVQTQVVAALDPAGGFKPGTRKLVDARDDLRDLAALMAHFGNADDDTARRAFQAAMDDALPNASIMYALPDDWQAALDRSLVSLARLSPEGKQMTVRALTRAIAADGKVTIAESELLRVVCAVLGCPLPPILGDAAA